jgi:hypothetical protein
MRNPASFFAISLEPNEATPHHWYSLLLARVGRMQEALKQAQKAQTLDPTSAVIASNLAGATCSSRATTKRRVTRRWLATWVSTRTRPAA